MKQWKLKSKNLEGIFDGLPEGLPAAAASILRSRDICSAKELQLFLQPPHRLPYCPLRLSGMEAALQRLGKAINDAPITAGRGKVGIVGDFDVDGISGAAILVEGLQDCGLQVEAYLPHRVSEGHGLSVEAVDFLEGQGVELIVTVDCGVSSNAEVERARQMGIDVIITDHHIPPDNPPQATAIINPCIPGDEYPFPHLCGAGLAFKLMQGLYQLQGRAMPPALLELVALGTIADLVPLIDENRYLVREGLKELGRTRRPGLRAMYRLAGLAEKPVNTDTVSFQIAPRLNAAGRMGHAYDSLRLLTTNCPREADALAFQLENQNRERQDLTRRVFSRTLAFVEDLDPLPSFITITDPELTPGVAGLVAGRVAEAFGRPAVAMASVGDGNLIGSGRSVPGFNLIAALNECADLLLRHGGHPQAAGFTINGENVSTLNTRLTAIATNQLASVQTGNGLEIDAEIRLADLNPQFLDWLKELEPCGAGNPKPLFMTPDLTVIQAWEIGDSGQHLKLLVSDGRRKLPALAFYRAEEWPSAAQKVDLAFTLSLDRWRGNDRLSLIVEDFRAH